LRLIFRNNFSIFKTNKNFILEKNRGFFAFHAQTGIVPFVGCDGLIVFSFTFLYIWFAFFLVFAAVLQPLCGYLVTSFFQNHEAILETSCYDLGYIVS